MIKFVLPPMAALAILYLCGAFVFGTFDSTIWSVEAKATMCVAWIGSWLIPIILSYLGGNGR